MGRPLVFASASMAASGPPNRLERRPLDRSDFDDDPAIVRFVPEGVTVRRDVPYGRDRKQRMDVYLPRNVRNAPVILMVHGGGWRLGDKARASVVENKVARWVTAGFVFVSANYRLLPEVDPLRQADDVAQALGVAQAQARQWGADPARFILMGHSAGAHLVALLSANPARAYTRGAKPWLGTVVLDSAALDAESVMGERHPRLYDEAFGADRGYWRSASPLAQLSTEARPMLLVCSTVRRDDSCSAASVLAKKAKALQVRAETLPQDLRHGDVNKNLGLPGAYTEAVDAYMRSWQR